MRYIKFKIKNYRAIKKLIQIDVKNNALIPLVGINEWDETTILQAIFCFDYFNDRQYHGNHLKNFLNLYHTSDENPKITAIIELSYTNLKKLIEEYNEEGLKTEGDEQEEEEAFVPIKIPFSSTDFPGFIEVTRDVKTRKYNVAHFDQETIVSQDRFSYSVISQLPYILYNDDFNDRPPTSVEIPNLTPNSVSGWLSIYERLFNVTDSSYSLFSIINEPESRRRDSIISDVQEVLNTTLLKAWRTFSLDNHSTLKVSLRIVPNDGENKEKFSNRLEINIIEKIKKKDRYFDVADRSKGFLWFFNFVMKLEFNPKISGNKKETIYLLDEPGSYLHASAQEKLCAKLKIISEKHGKVIFCTHSHHLLNPTYIPLNKIYIIKKKNKVKTSL